MFSEIRSIIKKLPLIKPNSSRLESLNQVVSYIKFKIEEGKKAQLVFICTHNSRRSQMAQVWAKLIAENYGIEVNVFSGGTEVTEFHPNAVGVFKKLGMKIEVEKSSNPHYFLSYGKNKEAIELFSKLYNDEFNPTSCFAAIMTCSSADSNCPYIPSAEKRIVLTYEDPKKFDRSEKVQEAYEATAIEIAKEMKYVFEKLKL